MDRVNATIDQVINETTVAPKQEIIDSLVIPSTSQRQFVKEESFDGLSPLPCEERFEIIGCPPSFDPNAYDTPLGEDEEKPMCTECNSIFLTWAGYEFHVMNVHVKYRPYKCLMCSFSFHSESEARYHMSRSHPAQLGLPICKNTDFEKETAVQNYFRQMKRVDNLGLESVSYRIDDIYSYPAKLQLKKFGRMKFKLPLCIRRQEFLADSSSQTGRTDSSDSTYEPRNGRIRQSNQFIQSNNRFHPFRQQVDDGSFDFEFDETSGLSDIEK